ncbi:unnamed protein product [Ranitomeya imitator]|uniref:Phosphatidic acid phosphatase type 2/haloperoxidase domain-containing protein n=1 Tax=Ranitomeya imitator TaxID=111125 RepID=A0ABN9L9X8_9NEOB|nr:unnamed protein product [Ranitomeya imitator]
MIFIRTCDVLQAHMDMVSSCRSMILGTNGELSSDYRSSWEKCPPSLSIHAGVAGGEDHFVWRLLLLQSSSATHCQDLGLCIIALTAGLFSFGLFCTVIFAGAVQTVTGNQAPHFLSVCRPNYTALGCKSHMQYISTPYACDGDPDLIIEARKAFPPNLPHLEHMLQFTLRFIPLLLVFPCANENKDDNMYVTLMLKVKGSRLVKPSLCLALLSPSWLLCLLRVAEYRNHWRDVLAGTITGAAIAVFLVTCVLNNFGSSSPEEVDLIQKEQEEVFEAENPLPTACEKFSIAKSTSDCDIIPQSHPNRILEVHPPMSPDPPPCLVPVTPDVLIPSNCISSQV